MSQVAVLSVRPSGKFGEQMKLITILVAGILATPVFAADSDWIGFDYRSGRIAFPIKLDGREVMAVIDARAEANGVARALDWAPNGDNVNIELAGKPVEVDDVLLMPLTSADFLIGKAFFRDYLLQIDYPNSRIRMLHRDNSNIKKTANVKMKSVSGSTFPVVEVHINGEDRQWLVLDPGTTSGLLLTRERALRKGWLDRFEAAEPETAGDYGDHDTFLMPEFMIGPYTLESVTASVPTESGPKAARILADARNTGSRLSGNRTKRPDGKLGYEILRNFVVTIDYRKSLLHLAEPVPES